MKTAETLFFWWKLFKIFWYLCIYFVQKRVELIAEKLIVGRRKMPNPSLNIICTVNRFKYKTPSHFNDVDLAWSRLDQKLCQFFFHRDVIFKKPSKMGPISCVIPYYIEIKESLYLGKFFSNFFENWYKMRKNTIILFLCKLFWGRCWNGDPLWGHFPEFFKAINYDQITIESSKLGTLYIFWGEKFDLQSF